MAFVPMDDDRHRKPNLDDEIEFREYASARDPLEVSLSEFMDEIRQGKTPLIEDYVRRYPELGEQIRDLFPLVGNLERWKSEKEIECLRRNVPKQFSFETLGEYQLVRELGRGGMGVVFQAFHMASHRSVAIKLLPWRFAADMSVWKDRLQREATTIAALRHPNIVQIFSFAEDQGYYYYVMQLVEGVGLDRIIQQLKDQRSQRTRPRKPQPTGPATEIETLLTLDSWRAYAKVGEQVALALACAHEHGVMHNDIKPSNLLIRSNGQVIVTDFGIGQPEPGKLSDTDDLEIGTLRYMAPERLSGNGELKSDIYSLGVTLYELATQTPVFEIQKRNRLNAAILSQHPTEPRRLVSEIPAPFEQIILKAMAKEPGERYKSARAMARDLRRFINRQPIHATKRSKVGRFIMWCLGFLGWCLGCCRFWRKRAK